MGSADVIRRTKEAQGRTFTEREVSRWEKGTCTVRVFGDFVRALLGGGHEVAARQNARRSWGGVGYAFGVVGRGSKNT